MPGLIIVLIGLLGWYVWLDWDRRLARWWARCVRGRSAGLVSVVVHLMALGGFGVALALGLAFGDTAGSPLWSLLVVLPAMMVYTPFMLASVPLQYGPPYKSWRDELESAGATPSDARQIAWWGGPIALVGLVLCVVSLFEAFLP